MSDEPEENISAEASTSINNVLTCGIIMPISDLDSYKSEHWSDVLTILTEVAASQGFKTKLVSATDEVSIIQHTIINNIYNNDIVICDVSGKNPNVMFELGMRLAFDKATIVIKDDDTDYTFDTSVIEHIEYPRDLRFNKILAFRKLLGSKLKATHEKSLSPDYSTFLRHFGSFNVQNLKEKDGGLNEYVINAIEDLRTDIANLKSGGSSRRTKSTLGYAELYPLAEKFVDLYALENKIPRDDAFSEHHIFDLTHGFSKHLSILGYHVPMDLVETAINAQNLPF